MPKAQISCVGHYVKNANFGAESGGSRNKFKNKAKKTDSESLTSETARGVAGQGRKEAGGGQGREPTPQMGVPLLSRCPSAGILQVRRMPLGSDTDNVRWRRLIIARVSDKGLILRAHKWTLKMLTMERVHYTRVLLWVSAAAE